VTNVQPLFDAIVAGDPEEVRRIVADDPSVAGARDDQDVSAVRAALYRGHDDIVEVLLDAEPPLDVFDAAALGNTEVVREVLDTDAAQAEARSSEGFTPLHLAAFFGRIKVAELLLNRGADPEVTTSNTLALRPLNSAAAGGHHVIAHLLLDRGADVDVRMAGGVAPLHAAANNHDVETTRLLLERGADPNAVTDDGRTVLDLAGDDVAVRQLLGS
jgi:ankyrin repeat protein